MTSGSTSHSPDKSPPSFRWRRGYLLLIIALAAGVGIGFEKLFQFTAPAEHLPVLAVVKADLDAVERDGRQVHFSQLRGKVVVCAYLYTVCPHGCAAVTAQLQQLNRELGGREDLHLLSVAVEPDRDTPGLLKAYAEAVGATPDSPWWFVTGERQKLWDFMTHELKLEPSQAIPPEEQLSPDDHFQHDLRVVLLDRQARVRRYYSVFHPQSEIASMMCRQLQTDVRRLLDDPAQ